MTKAPSNIIFSSNVSVIDSILDPAIESLYPPTNLVPIVVDVLSSQSSVAVKNFAPKNQVVGLPKLDLAR